MKNIFVLGSVSYSMMIYLEQFPQPQPQTVFSHGVHETVGSTGAGKALNLAKLGFDVALHGTIGDDDYGRYAISLSKKYNKPIWCDIHDYAGQATYHQDFINAADVVFMSSDALPDYRPFMQKQIANGKKLVVCTHGRQGSTALTPANEWIETPVIAAFAAAKVDTNGAGDAFFAGVLTGYAKGSTVKESLHWGTIAAGMCVPSPELAHPI